MCQKKNKIKYILRKYYYQICIIYMSSSSYNVILKFTSPIDVCMYLLDLKGTVS